MIVHVLIMQMVYFCHTTYVETKQNLSEKLIPYHYFFEDTVIN